MEMTLGQIGLMLALESKSVPKDLQAFQRLMTALHTPVGGLKIRRKN